MFKRTTFAAMALGLAMTVAPVSYAQEEGEASGSALSISGGVDWTSAYFYRGIVQESHGIIIQPYAEIGIDLGSVVEGLSANVGVWNSIHDERTGATGTSAQHYELDVYVGVGMDIPGVEGLSGSVSYTALTSPNGAFATVHELALGATYEMAVGDSGVSVEFGGLIVFELQNASDGIDEGVYYELSVTPSLEVNALEDMPITVSVPVVLGLGSDYYETVGDDDLFGYLSIGVNGSIALPVPAEFGSWSLSAGLELLILGGNTETANGGGSTDGVELIGTIGLGFEQ